MTQFQIITEQEIRTPYLQNVRFLFPYRKLDFDWALQKFVLNKLEDMREANPESLMLAFFKDPMNRAKLISVMWHLVAVSMIKVKTSA